MKQVQTLIRLIPIIPILLAPYIANAAEDPLQRGATATLGNHENEALDAQAYKRVVVAGKTVQSSQSAAHHSAHITSIVKQNIPQKQKFRKLIDAAQASASQDDPQQALEYYQQAYKISGTNIPQQRTALFGIAKMQLWLSDTAQAEITYQKILSMPLTPTEHEVALAGLVKSLSYRGKPMKAYETIPKNYKYTSPDMLIAAAQAANWGGWPQTGKSLLEKHADLVKTIDPQTRLYQTWLNVQRDIDEKTASNSVSVGAFINSGSDKSLVQRYGTTFAHQYSPPSFLGESAITSVTVTDLSYQKSGLGGINGVSYSLGQQALYARYFPYLVQVGGASLGSWQPFLWLAKTGYTPNDMISVSVSNYNEIVESFLAVSNRITANTTVVDARFNPFYRLRTTLALRHTVLSDKNVRNGYYTSASYLLAPALGLSAIVYARGFGDSLPNSPNYFDPKKFLEYAGLLRLQRHTIRDWHYYIQGGLGQQRVNDLAPTMSETFEIGIHFPFAKHATLDSYIGYSSSSFANPNGYTEKYLGVKLIIF